MSMLCMQVLFINTSLYLKASLALREELCSYKNITEERGINFRFLCRLLQDENINIIKKFLNIKSFKKFW